jgi:hypothetical protein
MRIGSSVCPGCGKKYHDPDTITLTRAELYAMRREIDTQPYEPREHYQMIADQGYNAAIDAILEKIDGT